MYTIVIVMACICLIINNGMNQVLKEGVIVLIKFVTHDLRSAIDVCSKRQHQTITSLKISTGQFIFIR